MIGASEYPAQSWLACHSWDMTASTSTFPNDGGHDLVARLKTPNGPIPTVPSTPA